MPDKRPSNRYRLLALDIDGTVLNSAQQVTPELKAALARLARDGVRTVLCTGRRWGNTAHVLREIEHAHPVVVCAGGAMIKEANPERTLYKNLLDLEVACHAAEVFRDGGLVPIFLFDKPLGERDMWIAEADRPQAETFVYFRSNAASFGFFPGGCPVVGEGPLEVFTMDRERRVRPAVELVRKGVGKAARVDAMSQPRFGVDQLALEVHAPTATKWNALQWLLGKWGIDAAEVIAIGDDVNDIPLLRAAGLSFAMGNASDEVKAAARAVTSSNDEHGVVEALQSVFGA